MEMDFVDNKLFIPIGKHSKECFSTGNFDIEPRRGVNLVPRRRYHTVGGPFFRSNMVIHSESPHTMRYAVYRLFHDKNGVAELHRRQRVMARDPRILDYLHAVSDVVCSTVPADHWTELNIAESDKSHVKRPFRRTAMVEIQEAGALCDDRGAYSVGRNVEYVRGNYKYEAGKDKKYCRITVDMSCPRSLFCGWLVDAIKHGMESTPYYVQGVECQFVRSPDPETVGSSFKKMYSESHCLYFSDDVAFALRCSDGMLWAELDISSCDSSNGPDVFGLLMEITPSRFRTLMRALMSQCSLPIRIGFGKRRVVAKPRTYFEYSGSLLTTLLNNLAVLMLLTTILSVYDKTTTRSENKRLITAALSKASHTTTLVFCDNFYAMTFLKMNPCRDVHGQIRAVLALGVILRACGRTNGDYAGSGDLYKRIEDHMRCWVMGLRHSGNTSLLRILEAKYAPMSGTKPLWSSNASKRFTPHSNSRVEMNDLDVCECYGMEQQEYQELCDLLSAADVGDGLACSASAKVLYKDYGLDVPVP